MVAAQAGVGPGVAGRWFQFAIVVSETGVMAGDCGLHCRGDDPRQFEVGITLSPDHQRRGYAAEAMECLVGFAFGILGAHRVSAVTDAENGAAAAVFRRVGFRLEAHFVENVWFKGRWGSEFVFGLLRREWEKQK